MSITDGFRLYRGTGLLGSVDFDNPLAEFGPAAEDIVLDYSGLEPLSRYCFVLRSVTEGVESADVSCHIKIATDSSGKPYEDLLLAPQDLQLTVSNGELRVSWISPPANTGANYELYLAVNKNIDLEGEADATVAAENSFRQFCALIPPSDGLWQVCVRAVDSQNRTSRCVLSNSVKISSELPYQTAAKIKII